jgi:uncharacterized protein
MRPTDRLTPQELSALEAFLASPDRPEGTLTLGELYGFFFAVTSAPELVHFSDALEFVFVDMDGVFQGLEDANRVIDWLTRLYNEINEGVVSGDPKLPSSVVFRDDAMANFDPECPVAQWARGFVEGHNWLEECWDLDLPEEMEEELPAVLMVLGIFWSRERADEYDVERDADEAPLAYVVERAVRLFQDSMRSYASMGRAIYLARMEVEGTVPFRSDPVPGRNDPCPCGSGRKYKKCCGASVH